MTIILVFKLIRISKTLGKSAAVGGAEAAAEAGEGCLDQDGMASASMRRRLFGKKKSQSEGMEPPVPHGTRKTHSHTNSGKQR